MLRRILLALFTLAVVTACSPTYDARTGTVDTPAATVTAPDQLDPLVSDGTWMVPQDIPFGTYRTQSTDQGWAGYYYTCADLACEIDFDGLTNTGRLDAQIVNGPGFLVLEEPVRFVHIERLILTPTTIP